MSASSRNIQTAIDVWTDRVARSGSTLAFRYKRDGSWRDLSWQQANGMARDLAGGLLALGLNTTAKVCIISQTRLEWLLGDLACVLSGLVSVPIFPSSTPSNCAFIIADAEARAIVVEDAAQLEKILPLVGPGQLEAICIGGDALLDHPDDRGRTGVNLADVLAGASAETRAAVRSLDDTLTLGRVYNRMHPDALSLRASAVTPAATYTIIYTSGTTGTPKGVVLSHGNLTSAVGSACRALTLRESDLQYLWLPLAHVLGREMAWAPILVGAPIAFTEGVLHIKDNLLEVRPTYMAGVPRIFEKFHAAVAQAFRQGSFVKRALINWALRVGRRYSETVRGGSRPSVWLRWRQYLADRLVFAKLRAKLGLDRCRFLLSGGAPLAAEIAEFFHAAGLLVLEGYGLSETFAACFVNRIEKFRFGTVGPALDVVEHKIADDGEILLRGPSVFHSYYRNLDATAAVFDEEGWFHSGDLGHFEDGCLKITDRKKDLIVTASGKKVAPQELESGIKMHCSLVGQAFVHGDRRPFCVALVTLNEEAVRVYGDGNIAQAAAAPEVATALSSAMDGLNANLPHYGRIRRFAVLPVDFTEAADELTPSMKIRRHIIVQKYASVIDRLYADGEHSGLVE
jgi:long-chain acyl-CoA synthetase